MRRYNQATAYHFLRMVDLDDLVDLWPPSSTAPRVTAMPAEGVRLLDIAARIAPAMTTVDDPARYVTDWFARALADSNVVWSETRDPGVPSRNSRSTN